MFDTIVRTIFGVRESPGDIVDGPPVRFKFAGGTYAAVFENKPQPSPGALSYAWESLALEQFTPIGPGTAVRQQISATQHGGGAWLADSSVWQNGVPTTAGQLGNAPLIDPDRGGRYTPPDITLGYPDAAGYNIVTERAPMTRYSDPDPYGSRRGV